MLPSVRLPLLVALAACGGAPASTKTPPPPPPPHGALPAPDAIAPAGPLPPPPPPGPGATVTAAVPTACGTIEMAAPAAAACTPAVVMKRAGVIDQVWQIPCLISPPGLLGDGTVWFGYTGGIYTVDAKRALAALPRKFENAASVGGTTFAFVTAGTDHLLIHGNTCERLPFPSAGRIGATSDGTMAMWGYARGAGARLVERASDASWRVYPPVADDLRVDLFEQHGRVVESYETTTKPHELGYFDANRQMHPIRRDDTAGFGLVQLVPGVRPADPPSALYVRDGAINVEVPDPNLGYRRVELALKHEECPRGGGAGDPQPSGDFVHRTPYVMFRANTGLWVAYEEAHGHCTYQLSRYGATTSHADPFLFAHPPPPPPMWTSTEIVEARELVLLPVGDRAFGTPVRVTFPTTPINPYGVASTAVLASRIRVVLGVDIIDIDPARLEAAR